jgi:predicted metal-dependent enzyme (double-stranded beta helix superfamily)
VFELDQFIADCRKAIQEQPAQRAIRELVARAVAEPGQVLTALGEPTRAGVNKLYQSPELTILNLVWGPGMTLMPHNHRMWAVIGIYGGREDNIFWRRRKDDDRIEAASAKALSTGDVDTLGRDIIHSVTNPIPRLTGALHVYGGDFFAPGRSEWCPERLTEQPYDVAKNMRAFEQSNAALARQSAA